MYFPDIVRFSTAFPEGALWLYTGDADGEPRFVHAVGMPANATIEARDEARQRLDERGTSFLGLRGDPTTTGTTTLAGNDIMLDSTGQLYLWTGRTPEGDGSWERVRPEDADDERRDRDRVLNGGDGFVRGYNTRAQWESDHHVTFTTPEPSIPAPGPTLTTSDMAEPPVTSVVAPNTVLHAAGGFFLIPAGVNDEGAPVWMSISTVRSSWTNTQARHTSAWRGREGQRVPSRDTFANWSGRLREVRPMTSEDLPSDIVDRRGRLWLHVGWHEGPRYKLAPGTDARYRNLTRRERMRSDQVANVPESGFNCARSWTADRIEREHGIAMRSPRTRMPERLVGFGDTAVNPGEAPAPAAAPAPAGPTVTTVDPLSHYRGGDILTRAHATNSGRACSNRGDRGDVGFGCTRDRGHVGIHIGGTGAGSVIAAVWLPDGSAVHYNGEPRGASRAEFDETVRRARIVTGTTTVDPHADVRPGPHGGAPPRDIFMEYGDPGGCRDSNPHGRWSCTRRSGHPGQHIASNDSEVVGVWHGSHYLNVRPSAGVGDSPEQYTAYLRTAGAASPAAPAAPAPTDPVAVAIAAAERAQRELAEYRERVRARAIQGRDVDHEYSSDEALNVSLRNLGLPERKAEYVVPVTIYIRVEGNEGHATTVASRAGAQMSAVTLPEGATLHRTAVGSPNQVTS